MKKTITIAALAGLATAAAAQSITLERINTIDLSGNINGQAASVAWNGTDLYVGEYANAAGLNGVVKVADATTAPAFSRFGDQATQAFRGVFGLDIQGDQLAVLHQTTGGAADDNGRVWDISGAPSIAYTSSSTVGLTGIGGIAFDPINGGAFAANFAGGFFRQFGPAGPIWESNNDNGIAGPFNFDGAWGTAWRGADMDDQGNIYGREGDQLVKFTRTGPDSVMTPFDGTMILNGQISAGVGDNTNGQGVEVADEWDVVFYNDRTDGAGGQLVGDVLKVVGVNGEAISLNFANSPADFTTNAWLDFSYDPDSNTLAVSNFSSNRVNIYRVTPTPGALAVLGLGGLAAARRRR
ncbi:MAG: PEP-CTERM sorting domain-containing protein [Planctomycetota bacterium]